MLVSSWELLPPEMKNEEVRPYWDKLRKQKATLCLKRFFDVILSILLLIILSPIFIVVAILIKLDSPGPIFYRQERITQNAKVFRIHKFRSMTVNADKIGSSVTVKEDPRITKIGKYIRKYRLDEIPQLLDVLSGDMTFVGTRPEVKKYVQKYSPKMYATLLLPAGITSMASIKFKDEANIIDNSTDPDVTYCFEVLPIKMKFNLEELKNVGIIYDFKLLAATLLAVLK